VNRGRARLAFLGKLRAEDWRRAIILAEILGPPLSIRMRGVARRGDETNRSASPISPA
jgi:hypothetical protein